MLRHMNAVNTLRVLRQMGSCSRADIVRALGLAAPTVTNVVKDLVAANLVLPSGEGKSKGGRPPDIIRFNAAHGCLAGVQITSSKLAFLVTDLDGTVLCRHSVKILRGQSSPERVCRLIQETMREVLKQLRIARKQLLALVVGVPAVTNVQDGSVVFVSTMDDWRSVPLRTMLEKLFGCRIVIENDANLAAQGERYGGAALDQDSFVYVSIGPNVSAGIVLQQQIHHGAQWCAGEIGYLRLPHLSRRKPTGQEFGELEELVTEFGLVQEWLSTIAGSRPQTKKMTAREILDLANEGDADALAVVRSRAQLISDILINLSLILNPGLILLGGEVGSHPAMLTAVRKELEGVEFAVTDVAAGTLGDEAVLWGAIALALEALPSILIPDVA
ncbi:ROK family protein [Terriglobus aquaticus]